MKLLYIIILVFGLLQLIRTKTLNENPSFYYFSAQRQLVRYYDEKLNFLASEICIQLKNLTVEILKDVIIQNAPPPLIQIFKTNLTHFQQLYSFYVRFDLNQTLITDFANMVAGYYYAEPHISIYTMYIQKLLREVGYDDLRYKYKMELSKFVAEKFLPKLKETTIQFAYKPNQPKLDKTFIIWARNLRQCREYECYLNNFAKSETATISETLENTVRKILDTSIGYSYNATKFAKNLLQDRKLSLLSPALKQQLIHNLQDFIKIYDNMADIHEIYILPTICYYVLFKFNNYENISEKDRRLITKLFDDHGYAQLELIYKMKSNDFLDHDYIEEFQHVKALQNPEEMIRLWQAIDFFRSATTSQNRAEAFKNFNNVNFEYFKELVIEN